jgi:hypothetical protein
MSVTDQTDSILKHKQKFKLIKYQHQQDESTVTTIANKIHLIRQQINEVHLYPTKKLTPRTKRFHTIK